MRTLYRFTRTGSKPADELSLPEWQIRNCFEPCTEQVRLQLEAFFRSKDKEISFTFGDSQVTVRKEVD